MRLKNCLAICLALALGSAVLPGDARAQTDSVTVSYLPGWNMVGGPAGTDLSFAGSLYVYGSNGYVTPPSMQAATCQGYWAYLSTSATLSLAGSNGVTTQTCALQPGWNMIGDPFAGVALLPSGTLAYHWNPQAGAYSQVDAIPAGRSDWIYSSSAASVTLQLPPPPPVSGTLVIHGFNHGPYQVHVGDTVTLILTGGPGFTVNAPPSLLQLVASGESDEGPFWTWKAIAPGMALIVLAPQCLMAHPPCEIPVVPDLNIEIDILA